ncbi:MAG: hypothetical protein IJ011_08870 [Clostridia bacterium]|nr:hypothetical protein [Clostridia bacterium]
MEKKLLGGNVSKNIVMGFSWLFWIFGLIAFIIDFKTLDVEEKREFVSLLICAAVGIVFGISVIVPIVVFVFAVIAAVNAFMGKTFKVPGAYHLAAVIIK